MKRPELNGVASARAALVLAAIDLGLFGLVILLGLGEHAAARVAAVALLVIACAGLCASVVVTVSRETPTPRPLTGERDRID